MRSHAWIGPIGRNRVMLSVLILLCSCKMGHRVRSILAMSHHHMALHSHRLKTLGRPHVIVVKRLPVWRHPLTIHLEWTGVVKLFRRRNANGLELVRFISFALLVALR